MFGTDDNNSSQQKSFLGRMIAMVGMLSLAYIMLIMSPEDYRTTLQAEIDSFKELVGNDDAYKVIKRSGEMYQYTFVDTKVVEKLEWLAQSEGLGGEKELIHPLIRIVENIKIMFYQSVYRMSVFMHWLALVFPLIFALGSDGYYKRKMKQYEFGISSANIYRIWIKAGIFAFFIIDVYFIFPASGYFGVLLPPLMFIILGISIRYALSNVSKVF